VQPYRNSCYFGTVPDRAGQPQGSGSEKRNIHFYVNVCGFAAIEFFCSRHPDPHAPDVSGGNGEDAMFRFVKRLR
jgi:hypothetical protein